MSTDVSFGVMFFFDESLALIMYLWTDFMNFHQDPSYTYK